MNPFKSLTLQWWQIGLFKLGLLAVGVLVGAYWHDLFQGLHLVLAAVAVGALGYVSYLWLKQ